MITVKTIEEHRDYLYQIVKLKLFFMHRWLQAHPDEPPVEVLRNRIDLYRKTDANPGDLNPARKEWDSPAWQTLERGVLDAYARSGDDAAAFEAAGYEILRPSLDARLARDFTDRSALEPYRCGSLRYHRHGDSPDEAYLHIANAVSPRSLFDNPLYLPSCFMVVLEQAEAELGVKYLVTSTWLNDNPKWQSVLPPEWIDSLGPRQENVQWHYGFWGQFITARGTFNEKLGAYLRREGRFRFYPRQSRCAIEVLRRHFAEFMRAGQPADTESKPKTGEG